MTCSIFSVTYDLRDQKYGCTKRKNYNVNKLIFSCFHSESTEVIEEIEHFRTEEQSVYLSTNDNGGLRENISEFYSTKFIGPPQTETDYQPIVEALLLDRTRFLLGNSHSTFTSNAILRRNYQNYAYFKVYIPYTSISVLWALQFLTPFILYFIILMVLRKCIRSSARLVAFIIEIGIIVATYILLKVVPISVTFGVYWTLAEPFICFFTPYCTTNPKVYFILTLAVVALLSIPALKWLFNNKL